MKKKNYFLNNELFKNAGLTLNENLRPQNRNLLIGKNGSGKTRFLKTLEKLYEKEEFLITLFFPEINASYVANIDTPNISITSLYDIVYEKEVLTFKDFLKLCELDAVSFIEDIFQMLSIKASRAKARFSKDLNKLNNNLKLFIKRTLHNNPDHSITIQKHLNNNIIRELSLKDTLIELSPGELILFYLSIFLFYLEHINKKNIILLLDEPELHLHPKALIAFMNMIINSSAINQLWVATHSLFIMPLFSFEQLLYLKNDQVIPLNHNTYNDIYNDLVGLEDFSVFELLKSVENWSYYQFISENFLLPTVKNSSQKPDEQILKLVSVLKTKTQNNPLRVLDYGAGKCRLLDCLKQLINDKKELNKLVSYEGYDPHPPKNFNPKDIIYLTKQSELKDSYYDIVILMNVLHEIDPTEWTKTFNIIYNILAQQGILIFLEVLSLTNGEQPYGQSGYLLLQDKQVKELFPNSQIKHLDSILTSTEKTNCWVIPKQDLNNITYEQVVFAINSLKESCESQLEFLDKQRISIAQQKEDNKQNNNYTIRKYAFLSQQFINALLANKRLTKNSPIKSSDNDNEIKLIFPGLSNSPK